MTTTHPFIVILLGPPGVGKGTQALKIHNMLKLPHISTGDILRANIKQKTPLGLETQSILEKGELVSDEIINKMVLGRITQEDCKKGFILDGYPRTLAQAHTLEKSLHPQAVVKVLLYTAKQETIITRISGRLTCKHCGQVFHSLFNPPKKTNICDNCSHELTQRKDDQAQIVLERLKLYQKEIDPLVQLYHDKKLLHSISCEGSIDEAFAQTVFYLNT
jgi:adenylate kinase